MRQMPIEILVAQEVAVMLRVSLRHVYELTHPRTRAGDLKTNPLPCFRIGTSVRFIRKDVEEWIERLANAA